jgi:hypothetical protein
MARRASERGTAIFIVVMVMTMLTAIGIFAIRAASLGAATSGYDRQNTQNHYVGEYGMLTMVSELSTTRRSAYVNEMTAAHDKCWATQNLADPSANVFVPCYRLYTREIQRVLPSGHALFDPATGDGGTLVSPGSLGPSALDGDFVVEMTDPGPAGAPVAGSDVGGTGPRFRYLQLTLTSIGQVRPAADPTVCDTSATTIAGDETGRAFVVIGPMP